MDLGYDGELIRAESGYQRQRDRRIIEAMKALSALGLHNLQVLKLSIAVFHGAMASAS